MTAGPQSDLLPASQVAELINGLGKALRAFQMYLPNNPIYQRATDNLRAAFSPIWAVLDELVLTVVETDFVWEEQVVYHQPNKNESLAWGLFKDGMRSLTLRRGAEQEELTRFLEMINRARYLPTDAGDDLLTLLWEQEFQYIQYQFVEFFGEGGGAMPEQTGTYPTGGDDAAARQRREQVAEEAPPKPKGVVDLEDFDSTLYFLDESRDPPGRAGGGEGVPPRRPHLRAQRPVRPLRARGRPPDAVRGARASSTTSSPISSTPATSGRPPQSCARPSSWPPAARDSRRRSSRGSTTFVGQAERAGDRVASCCSRWTRPRRSPARRTWRKCCASCGRRRWSRC